MILITGGAGYIGSHIALALLQSGKEVLVVDSLVNSSEVSLDRIEKICGKRPLFKKLDIRNYNTLVDILKSHPVEAVIHCAGLKSVADSVAQPLEYYDNNINSTTVLCRAMSDAGIFNLVFSSSATVYGVVDKNPIAELSPTNTPENSYGKTKLIIEGMLFDLHLSNNKWSIAILRYFNPVGAHKSGLIGEAPNGIPNNLFPYITKVLGGELPYLAVFGDDYNTHDGTGVRDYIHVMDLVDGHLRALDFIVHQNSYNVWNLGTGVGYSVLDVVKEFEAHTGHAINYTICDRRDGDVEACWADPHKAKVELQWEAKHSLLEMIKDTVNWQRKNPNGYV